MSLTPLQWLKLAAGAVTLVPRAIAVWPTIRPLVMDTIKLIDELHGDAGKGEPMTAKEFVTRSHSLSADDERLFDRMSNPQ